MTQKPQVEICRVVVRERPAKRGRAGRLLLACDEREGHGSLHYDAGIRVFWTKRNEQLR